MTSYPAAGDYYKAVQAPARAFTVPKLQQARFVWDALGPTLARGSSAVVFQAAVDGSQQALRCYIRNDASSRDRYSALGDFLAGRDLDPFVSPVTWTDAAIRVNGATWPVLQMPWIDGRTLNEYVDFLVAGSNAAALTLLAARWRELIALLQRVEFAHGDLQHGNILVDTEGTLRLVDFDGIWIPQLAGLPPPTEYGHPNYQHPTRRVWGRWLDTFSALVIYLSLVALGKDPSLWLALYNSKNLLFSKPDFSPPFQTEVWKQLAALRDPQVTELARRLQECCDPSWTSSATLETILAPPPAPPTAIPRPTPAASSSFGPPSPPGAPSPPGPPGPPPAPPWWERPPLPQPPPSQAPPAPSLSSGSPRFSAAQAVPSETMLPAPPPLSAPLGTAGTGPMPQLSRTMAPPGTTWWTAQGHSPGTPPAPPAKPGPAAKPGAAARTAAIGLGLGVLLLIIGAATSVTVLVFIGLTLGAGGIYWLIARTGTSPPPP